MTVTSYAYGGDLTASVEQHRAPVVDALARVMAEMPGIGKDQQASAQQGGYAYRGIEAITRAAQPLLAKHGVVFVPQVRQIEVVDIVVGGKPWTDTRLTVAYTIYGPEGSSIPGPVVVGIGRDGSDKGSNKALSQAYKYCLLQVLCISDAADDADGHTAEADALPKPAVLEGWASVEEQGAAHRRLADRIKVLPASDRGWCKTFRDEHGWPLPRARYDELAEAVAAFEENMERSRA